MAAITIPPTPSTLSVSSGPFSLLNIPPVTRLAILVEAKIVLLNFKGGKSYIGNHEQLMIDALAAYLGFTGEAWGSGDGQTAADLDPGPNTVALFVQQANFRDSVNMPLTLAAIMLLMGHQFARPVTHLQMQNAYLDLLLLGRWG